MCMVLLLRLHFYHLTMRNVLAVHYAQINTHLKMPTYPIHSGYYSPAIKFIIFSLPKFHFVRSVLFEKAKGIRKSTDYEYIYACITFLLSRASDVKVNFEVVLDHLTKYLLT